MEGGYALAGAGEGDTGSQLSISLTPGHNAAPSKGHFLAPGTRAWPCSAAWTHLPELDTELLLRLQQPVTPEWINGLRIMGSYEYILGRGPERFSFSADSARIPADEGDAQQIVHYFKQWLPQANRKYREVIDAKKRQEEERQRRDLQAQITEQERKQRIIRDIHI